MCGIGGILRVWASGDVPGPLEAIPEAWLDTLDASIAHRGPDGRGRFRHRVVRQDGVVVDVALVHRRLSIIDHVGGGQPMVIGRSPGPRREGEEAIVGAPSGSEGNPAGGPRGKADAERGWNSPAAQLERRIPPPRRGVPSGAIRSNTPLVSMEGVPYAPINPHVCPACEAIAPGVVAVVFNGCIYNHRDLRRALQAAGHVFVSDHSDTEVLLHGWRQWGAGLADRLDGMYAAAIWDESASTPHVLRDFAGEKPVYTLRPRVPGVWACASAPAGLIRLNHELDPDWATLSPGATHRPIDVGAWLRTGGWRGPLPVTDVREVEPGSLRSVGGVGASLSESDLAKRVLPHRRDSASDPPTDFERLLTDAVVSRLESDVPLGCFLSGGIDSGLIAAIANRHLAARGDRLRTFTVRMPDGRFDESTLAERTASALGTEHTTLDCTPMPAADLCRLIPQLGLPFGDSSLLPTFWVASAARQHVKVALAGDGGDELFGGYDRHAIAPWYRRFRPLLALVPFWIGAGAHPKSGRSKLARLARAARSGDFDALRAIFDRYDFRRLLGDNISDPEQRSFWDWRSDAVDPLRADFETYLPGDLLRKTDTASMAAALEVRAPFLARELALAALSEPLGSLMRHGQRKGLLRAVARKYLPAEIVDRPKQGFAIPISCWFRNDFGQMRALLLDHLTATDPFPGLADAGIKLNMGFVRRMLKEHDDAGVKSLWPWKGRDHGQRLYMLLVLSIWCRWLAGVRKGG